MSSCEKCWADAFGIAYGGSKTQSEVYQDLVKSRPPCTPAEQAGPDHGICSACGGATHQYTGQCMACHREGEIAEVPKMPDNLLKLVHEQAEDEGLWFVDRTAPEAYLQQELRKLHALIEELTKRKNTWHE